MRALAVHSSCISENVRVRRGKGRLQGMSEGVNSLRSPPRDRYMRCLYVKCNKGSGSSKTQRDLNPSSGKYHSLQYNIYPLSSWMNPVLSPLASLLITKLSWITASSAEYDHSGC